MPGDYDLDDLKQRANAGDYSARQRLQFLGSIGGKEPSVCREFSIGLAYCIGDGVPQDLPEAFKWYSEAAEKDCVDAKFSLGMCYEHGKGVDVDILSAASWYWSAATDGHQDARRRVDVLAASDIRIRAWRDGLIEDLDDLPALDLEDQFGFGAAYHNGDGVDQNLNVAIKWYLMAANAGHPAAQNNLGICYDRGDGVPQDCREAAKWYRSSADQGDETAQFNLGLCHLNGTGVPKDMVLAYKWFNLAAANGHKGAAEERDEIEGKMLSSQVAEAQKLSRQFPR